MKGNILDTVADLEKRIIELEAKQVAHIPKTNGDWQKKFDSLEKRLEGLEEAAEEPKKVPKKKH